MVSKEPHYLNRLLRGRFCFNNRHISLGLQVLGLSFLHMEYVHCRLILTRKLLDTHIMVSHPRDLTINLHIRIIALQKLIWRLLFYFLYFRVHGFQIQNAVVRLRHRK